MPIRKRSRANSKRAVLSSGEVVIELGVAYFYGDEADPIRALFMQVPDVRDIA